MLNLISIKTPTLPCGVGAVLTSASEETSLRLNQFSLTLTNKNPETEHITA